MIQSYEIWVSTNDHSEYVTTVCDIHDIRYYVYRLLIDYGPLIIYVRQYSSLFHKYELIPIPIHSAEIARYFNKEL